MSITDELRKWAQGFNGPWKRNEGMLLAIADRIDEAHEKALAEQYASLTIDMEPMTDENMSKGGWVRLPVDGDGVPIHVGDVIHYDYDGVRTGTPETVRWIAMGENEIHITTDYTSYTKPSTLRHYKQTVEDLLLCFSDRVCESDQWGADAKDTIAEFAPRIREAVLVSARMR